MLYKILPDFIFKRLFGDRKRFGLTRDTDDAEWKKWERGIWEFYEDTQRDGRGSFVNRMGFRIMRNVDLSGRTVLEIGPGRIEHLAFTASRPAKYVIADTNRDVLGVARDSLARDFLYSASVPVHVGSGRLPFKDASIDCVLTFHQLEHVVDPDGYMDELGRILKPGGILAGAVPAEGGLFWGMGRFFTTRRYVHKRLGCDYDKIICWEHPSFVDAIKRALDGRFQQVISRRRPLPLMPFDFNLSWGFVYRKPA